MNCHFRCFVCEKSLKMKSNFVYHLRNHVNELLDNGNFDSIFMPPTNFFINILITNNIELQRPNVFAKIAVNCANRMYPDEFIRWGMLKKEKSPNFNAPYAAFGWAAFILLIGTPRRTYPNRPSVRFVAEVSVHRMRTRFVCDFNRNSDCHFKRSAITLIVKNSLFRSTWNECTANVQSAIFVKKHSAVSQF